MDVSVGEVQLARCCLTYLNFETFACPPSTELKDWESITTDLKYITQKHPLLNYASINWMSYAHDHFGDSIIFAEATKLFGPSKSNNFIVWSKIQIFRVHAQHGNYIYMTTLHWAASFGLHRVCAWLLEQGCNVNSPEPYAYETPLICCLGNELKTRYGAYRKREALVDLLIQSGADVNLGQRGAKESLLSTILEESSDSDLENDYRAIISHLLNANVRITAHDIAIVQSRFDRTSMICPKHMLLLQKTSLPNLEHDAVESFMILKSRWKESDTREATTTDLKVTFEGQKILDQSLQSAVKHGQSTTVSDVLKKLFQGPSQDSATRSVQSALRTAAEYNHFDILKLLFGYTKDVDFIDDEGNTLVHLAIKSPANFYASENCPPRSTDTLACLLEHGVTIGHLNMRRAHAIHSAAYNDDPAILKMLLQRISVDDPLLFTCNTDDKTPLWISLERKNDLALETLLDYYSVESLSAYTRRNQTYLQRAVLRGTTKALELLHSQGISLNEVAFDGSTAIHHAAANSETATSLVYLVQNGARYDVQNTEGLLPLHVICQNTSKAGPDMLRYISRMDGFATSRSLDGRTPLQFVVETAEDKFTEYCIENIEILLQADPSTIDISDCTGGTPLIALSKKCA